MHRDLHFPIKYASITTEICIRIKRGVKRRSHMEAPRIKWRHLKGEKQRIFQLKILEGGFSQAQGSANDMWDKMAQYIRKVAKETLGESRGFGPRGKESWWWNESVQSNVRIKREFLKIGLAVRMPKLGKFKRELRD